ncbi:MAG TPA: HD domain-containing phosphohydrolase [Chloroflexota bacterium]|nr:HD domain-containing phosphohydrolase [Chloroflexota bacterium]
MMRDFRRVQDLVLVLARWAVFAGLLSATLEMPNLIVPLPLVGALGLYALFLTIVFVGAWAGTAGFGHVQSLGDLGLVAAAIVLAPNLLTATYLALLVVALLIGMRRFPWPPTAGYAVLAAAVGTAAWLQGFDVLAWPVGSALPGVVVLFARLLSGDPLPADYLERRPPVRTDQVRALQGLGKTLGERSERQALLAEAHRLLTAHTGATRAAIALLDGAPDDGHIYTFNGDDVQSKPIVLERSGSTPPERVLRDGRLRLNRQREPLPIVEILGERGASSFLGVALRSGGETLGALLAYDKEGGRPFTDEDEAFLELLAPALAASLYGGRVASEAAQSADIFPRGLLAMLALRRPEAEVHAEQVARFAIAISEQMELSHDEMQALHLGALLHDVGELAHAEIYNRTQMLSATEYERVKEHPWAGARLLAGLDQAAEIVQMVHQHHERWDGTGYPQALARADIARTARILAVADALDAMTAERPYRAPRPVREALQELVGNSGTQFDPAVVQALLAVVAEHGEGWVAAPPRRQRPAIEPWSGRIRYRSS